MLVACISILPRNMMWVVYKRMVRLVRIGVFLHVAALVGVVSAFGCTGLALEAWEADPRGRQWAMLAFLASCCGGVALVAMLDLRSRFQEYKRAKDLFFENGFQPRIAGLFIYSRCQRDAVREAARDLGVLDRLDRYYADKGYRWFHVLPDVVYRRPGVLLSRGYWRKTLFEPCYQSRYYLW